jgi:hypothetical protein
MIEATAKLRVSRKRPSPNPREAGKSMSQKDMAWLDAKRNPEACSQALLSDVGENKDAKRFLIKCQENVRNRLIQKVSDGLTSRIPLDPGGTPCELMNKREASIDRWHD